jgi:alpha-soluble NSF attachment protein
MYRIHCIFCPEGGLFGGKSNQDEALEMFGRAANLFKMAKKWSKAGQTFSKIADRHLQVKGM